MIRDPRSVAGRRSLRIRSIALLVVVAWLMACSTPRPILRGPTARDPGAGAALRECMEADRDYRESSRGRRDQASFVALAVLFTALSGAGFGAIYGAYYDDPGEAAATGAVVGAGVGLIGGPLFLMSKTRRDSKIRVESCARKRGYDVVGWR